MERAVVVRPQLVRPQLGLTEAAMAETCDGPAAAAAAQLYRLVAAVAVAGAGATAVLAVWLPDRTDRAGWGLVVLLLALTAVAESTAVRLRHGDAVEELTLFEAAVVVDVLLLPPAYAVLVSVVALAVACAVRRRSLLKSMYNLGSHATSTALLVAVFHLAGDPARPVSPRSVVALLAGTLGFAALNLLTLARVLSLVEGVTPRSVVCEGWRLSAFMAVGNAAVGSVAVALVRDAPALAPFAVLPAVALTVAYRAAAHEADERHRSARVLELTASLAERRDAEEHLVAFLRTARLVFRAAEARVVLDGPSGPTVVVADDSGVRRGRVEAADVTLLVDGLAVGATTITAGAPDGWPAALLAPLEADGTRVGVIGFRVTARQDTAREERLLTPLASALAVALRSAAHLADLEEERTKLRAVVDHSSDGMLVLDADGVVLVWNPAMAALTGITPTSAYGRNVRDLLVVTDHEGAVVATDTVLPLLHPTAAPRVVREHGVVRGDGEQRWVSCAHSGIFDDAGGLVRDVVVVHDETRQRQVDRMKNDFVATVTHELRTPLTPIKGYTELLRRRGAAMTDAKRSECLDVIADRVSHLNRIIEDLLLVSGISTPADSSDGVAHTPHDLARLVRRAVDEFPLDADRVCVSAPGEPVVVTCDATRTVQVVANLLANALRYSSAEDPVEVALTTHDGHAAVTVSDHGRGIPDDQLERIFDKFVRLEDPMTMTTGGSGLGLYIARHLARAMGATLTAHSTLGVGSTFVLTVPLAAPVPAPRQRAQDHRLRMPKS